MTADYPFANYRVLITPLISEGVYGTTIDITQDLDMTDLIKSFSNVKQEIDNGDYDIGIFTFGNLTMRAINYTRKFNDHTDADSIFSFTRDKAKVEIQYRDADANQISQFKGLINEDATRQDTKKDTVRFKVLSLDSIFRQVSIPSGAIATGELFSSVIKKILNVPEITNVIGFNPANINVNLDLTIDDGEVFSNVVAKTALDDLLRASNSILYIDINEDIIVTDRAENLPLYALFGGGDDHGRENILSINKFNNGEHRVFNSVKIGDTVVSEDSAWIAENGVRQKSYSFDFITTASKEEQIADRILNHFRVPKMECEIVVITEDVKQTRLLDLVRIGFDFRASPDPESPGMPIYGIAEYDTDYYPHAAGSFRITQNISWKVIGISINAMNFTTTLKLRQSGTEANDGFFLSALEFDKTFNSQNIPVI